MEGEGRLHEHEAQEEEKEQQIIDALPSDVRNDRELMEELSREALQDYLRKSEKLAALARELSLPVHINWFSHEGNEIYKQRQQEAGIEPQFTKLVPPYPWLYDRSHNAGNLVEAARMLYTHGIGEEGPLDMRDLMLFLNMALVSYGLEVVPTQPPTDDPVYRHMEVKQPATEEAEEHKIIDFPRQLPEE